MEIKLSEKEIEGLRRLARGYHGKTLIDYLNRLVNELKDLTTLKETEAEKLFIAHKGREEAIKLIQDNLIDFLIKLKPEIEEQNFGEYE